MPPGKFIADRGSAARRGAPTSTRQRFVWTSIIRPTTRSPISGVYRALNGRTERSLFVFCTVPATVAMISVLEGAI